MRYVTPLFCKGKFIYVDKGDDLLILVDSMNVSSTPCQIF